MDDQIVSRAVEVPLTEADRAELARQLSSAVDVLGQLNSHKKAVVADLTGDIKSAEAKVLGLNAIFRAGYRVVAVPCRVIYHEPRINVKRFVSLETAEQVGHDEYMTAEEIQANAQRTLDEGDDSGKRSRKR